ncbi:MAG: FIST C-terminal domain-containing protein [Chloroflexi bacterium]|nr:FIST C-terminal domain-containing protein [Chloroflexota bacterium]
MKWASSISEQTNLEDAIKECIAILQTQMQDEVPHLAVAFVSPHHQAGYDRVSELIRQGLDSVVVLGCSGGGIIGNGQEVEQRPAVSITAASLPGVEIVEFHLEGDSLPDLDAAPEAWEEAVNVTSGLSPQFVMLADPFSFPVQNLLLGLDYAFSQSAKIGGMASGAQQQGGNALFLGDQVYRSGAVGVALHGNITVDTVVAQGCRPVGQPMRVTESRRNILAELDGQPPMTVLKEIFEKSDDRDKELMRNSLFLGVVMDEFIDDPKQGDFLIRNVVGMDDRTGVLAIGEMLKEGQLVQFHLRDAQTSADDLTQVLERYAEENRENQAQGALLFSCLGRGEHLYGRPNHDTELFQDKLGSVPLGGFFCNGEIGPVSGTTFLHGYTSSFGIFRVAY